MVLFRRGAVLLLVVGSANAAAGAAATAVGESATAAGLPPGHPSQMIMEKFSPNFRCPHAAEWVAKGPRQAALDMGLLKNATEHSYEHENDDEHSVRGRRRRRRRRTQMMVPTTVAGSCAYASQWTGPSCLEFRGDTWTADAMQTRCITEDQSTLTAMEGCPVPEGGMGGYCIVSGPIAGAIEASAMMVSPMSDCAQLKTGCEGFGGGSFVAAEACGASDGAGSEAGGEDSYPAGEIPGGSGLPNCMIAPGAIGAGHQSGFSAGYDLTCPGTPAEGSPYMWPVAWSANVEAKSMMYGSDDVLYHSKGAVAYRLDKNWKRMDWHYQRGVQRGFGQAPCDPANIVPELSVGQISACRRDSDEYRTMIHRGGKMAFITWKNDTEQGSSDPAQIESCNWLDMAVIGNIRPDWYMDARGDSTDVQYLGDQHVFHENEPRLVKQWRKQDFADQYFVMSVLANPKEDGIHWPMILNVPGEGVGDDFLQTYTNHSLVADEDDYLFLLDEALEAIGGSCPEMLREEFGFNPASGNEAVYIPSNLEVDPNSWFTNEVTYSPVWIPVVADEEAEAEKEEGFAITEEGRVIVTSCYDNSSMEVQLSVEFTGVEMLDSDQMPWLAVGYRESEECKMNPENGDDSKIIMLNHPSPGVNYQAHLAALPSASRRFDETAISSISASATPLAQVSEYSDVYVFAPAVSGSAVVSRTSESASLDSVTLHFKQSMSEVPDAMNMMYAIGSSPEIQFHESRGCFQIVDFPTCPNTETEEEMPTTTAQEANGNGSTTPSAAFSVATFASLLVSSLVVVLIL